jgi:hypothetical protein
MSRILALIRCRHTMQPLICTAFSLNFCLLQDLKRAKKQKMKEIIEAMETFNSNLQNSRRLVKKLERDRCRQAFAYSCFV